MPATFDHLYSDHKETLHLLSAGQVWAHARLEAEDMLGGAEAAKLAGTDLELLNRNAADGRLIGIPSDAKGMVFPRWQFSPAFKTAIRVVSQELHSSDGWVLLRFFESPQIALDGLSPKQAIEQGHPLVRIIDLARASKFA